MSRQIHPKRTIICRCGKEFVTTHPTKKACSKQCGAFQCRYKVFRCVWCSSEFIGWAYRIGIARFCSPRCLGFGGRLGLPPAEVVADAPPPAPKPKRMYQCQVCGIRFYGRSTRVQAVTVCCSRKCSSQVQNFSGIRNPNYRHGQCVGEKPTKEYRKAKNDGHRFRQIDVLLKRQHGRCPYCKKKITSANADIDHIMPLARGGSNHRSNLQAACRTCNRRKLDKLPEIYARQMGYLL